MTLDNDMNEKELELVERLITSLGANADATIDAYVVWFIAGALCWIAVGIGFFYAAHYLWKREPKKDDDVPISLVRTCAFVAAFVGAMFIVVNIPDLVAPRAIAIHQLLQDVTP